MSNALALKPPSTIKEALAALIALGIVLGGANLAAIGLKNVLDASVRSSVIGMFFASVPAVYGFSNRALNGFKPKHLEFPELSPWYVSGLLAGACLYAWIQFVAFIMGAGLAIAFAQAKVEPQMTVIATAAGLATLVITAPASLLAGMILNRSTRSLVFLAVLLAAILCVGLSVATSWMLVPAYMNELMKDPLQALLGVLVPSAIVLVFSLLGVGWSALWRQRSIGRVAHAVQRLKPDQRDKVFADVTNMLGAQAAVETGVEGQGAGDKADAA